VNVRAVEGVSTTLDSAERIYRMDFAGVLAVPILAFAANTCRAVYLRRSRTPPQAGPVG
jgi:hypothetical protein